MKVASKVVLLALAGLALLAASASANWDPAGSNSLLSASGIDLQTNGSNVITTCTTSTAALTLSDPASSSVSAPAGDVVFNGCTTNVHVGVTVKASAGDWTFTVLFNAGGSSWFTLVTMPQVTARYTLFGVSCTVTAPAGSALAGQWTNATHSLAVTGDILVNGSGGLCGGAGQTATFTGVYTDQTLSIS